MNESQWDKLLKIRTSGLDDSRADQCCRKEENISMKTRGKLYRKLIVLMGTLLVAAGNCAAAKAEAPAADPIGEIIAGMSLQEKVGQLVIADFRSWNDHPEDEASEPVPVTELREEIRDMIRRDYFGGIILFAENCGENEQMMKLINEMQGANLDSGAAHKIPLLTAIDQEGGTVVRLGQGTNWIGNMALAATGDPENAREAGNRIGRELSALGVNVLEVHGLSPPKCENQAKMELYL